MFCFRFDSYDAGQALLQVAVVETGEVYVGGSNTLLHLSQNLTPHTVVSLGPVRDSLDCDPAASECEGSFKTNEVKVLEVDKRKQQLLMCGSVRQGVCRMYSLRNISRYTNTSTFNLSSFVGGKKSVAVLFDQNTDDTEDILFVGQEYDGRDHRFSPNVISTRKVDTTTGFQIDFLRFNIELQLISGLDINPDLKAGNFRMEFVDILQDDDYVYFVTIQQKSTTDPNNPYPRLGRICFGDGARDVLYASYVEIGLLCKVDDVSYPKILATTIEDGVLYFSAGRSDNDNQWPFESNLDERSVVCAVPMSKIENRFMQVNHDCYGDKAAAVQIAAWKSGADNLQCTITGVGAIESLHVNYHEFKYTHTTLNQHIENAFVGIRFIPQDGKM